MKKRDLSKLTAVISLHLAVLLIPACDKANTKSSVSDVGTEALINGDDNRFVVASSDPIYRTVGGIGDAISPVCTAFKFDDSKYITARHCVVDEQGKIKDGMRFYTLNNGVSYPIQSFIQVEQNADIAYFSVDGYRVSDKLELANSSSSIKNLTVYSADVAPNRDATYAMDILEDDNCMFLGQDPNSGLMMHSCDTVAGSSGSPIIANGKVVGIHLGAMTENYKNASGSAKMVNIACPVDLTDHVDANNVPYQGECGCSWRCPGSCHPSAVVPPIHLLPGLPPFLVPGIPGNIQPKSYDPDSNQVKRFAICINMPSPEAATCLSMIMGCFPAAVAAGVGYPVCIVATCGSAGAEQVYRCSRETGISG